VCEGELRQVAGRGNFELSEKAYLDIINAKTAQLCGCCCRLGAHYAGAPSEVVESLAACGDYLGMAFQIVDDVLDLAGSEAETGKSLGSDLAQGKATLPLIRLLSLADANERREMTALLQKGDDRSRALLCERIAGCGALDYALDKARHFARLAESKLHVLPSTDAVDALHEVLRFVVLRRT
jgi:octaprenyl-diphosphate synthase